MVEKFNCSYYRGIWPSLGVHRHDYCESTASMLIAKYRRCKMLDVGTGCGYLVRVLREKGFDAWGLELSQHAIANTCAPGFILQGSVCNIPWKDKSFDVIHSSGLWAYIEEHDLDRAVSEIHRVGKRQEHNIDYNRGIIENQFVTLHDHAWWEERLKSPKILVGCPTHTCKEYAHDRWIDAVRSFTYSNYDIFVVDNSPSPECVERWPWITHVPETRDDDMCVRIGRSMELIRRKFLAGSYKYWFSLEIDVIPQQPDVIERILATLNALENQAQAIDWFSHTYPVRGENENKQSGVGFTMFSRKLMQFIGDECGGMWESGLQRSPDAWLWQQVRPNRELQTLEYWNLLPVQHLAGA